MAKVLVTGGSGFIGSHCILQLLAAGHQVRTTVRDLKREGDVRGMLRVGGADPGERLSFIAADLEKDEGWPQAVAGCDYVLHVASPLPPSVPKNEDELIVPAREGTLRVLRAARDAGVKRVVVTGSFAAIGYGHSKSGKRRSRRRIGRIRTAMMCCPTRNRRFSRNGRLGISWRRKVARWSYPSLIRWEFSGRSWEPIIRRRSCWCNV